MKNISRSIEYHKRVIKCYIETVLLYDSDSCIVNEQIKKNFETMEMWISYKFCGYTERPVQHLMIAGKTANESKTLCTSINKETNIILWKSGIGEHRDDWISSSICTPREMMLGGDMQEYDQQN